MIRGERRFRPQSDRLLQRAEPGTCAITARRDRLTTAQHQALSHLS